MDNKKTKKATKAQRERIMRMLESGLIDHGGAQGIIEGHSKPPKRRSSPDPHLAFWEEKYPGKGAAIMDILRPFYGWKLELKPSLPDLEARAKGAIFWREIKGVRVFHQSDAASLRDSLRASFWASLRVSLGDSLGDSLGGSLRDSLGDSLGGSLGDSLGGSLWYSLFYPCGFILADKPDQAARFKPLLNLWLTGNFPIGFDKDGNLLVLVA